MGAVKQVEIEGRAKRETAAAILFDNGHVEVWVPKSVISDQSEDDDGAIESIFIPEWIAEEKGLI